MFENEARMSSRPTKVLALTRYSSMAASTRQRFDQYVPHLGKAGFEITSAPLFGDEYVASIGKSRSKALVARSYAARLVNLVRAAGRFDAAWVQYDLFPFLPGFAERALRLANIPYIVDYDDALFHNYDRGGALKTRLLGGKLTPLLAGARGCAAGNAYLADYLERYNRNVRIIPTVVDTEHYTVVESRNPRPVVGWIGSPSTWRYVEPILPQILPVIEAAGGRFRAVGSGRRGVHGIVEFVDWAEAREIEDVQQFDIGIMPLPDEEWARGKCGYKLIQYMACGRPTIASPVGVNRQIVEHGVNGHLASSSEEWRSSLEALLESRERRESMGSHGRRVVEGNYSLHSQIQPMVDLFDCLRVH